MAGVDITDSISIVCDLQFTRKFLIVAVRDAESVDKWGPPDQDICWDIQVDLIVAFRFFVVRRIIIYR